MVRTHSFDEARFGQLFAAGDVRGAETLLDGHSEVLSRDGYDAHPLLRAFVEQNDGHCYREAHLRIADLLTPDRVQEFRDAVLGDRVEDVRNGLRSDEKLVHADITAGRGIAQAIHHWKSVAVAKLLVESGANLAALTTRGESPLSMQLRFGTLEGVRYLLESGVDPNHGAGGHLPSQRMVELIQLMLAYGWDINNGQLLHDANHGYANRVKTWVENGADANARNASGQTALHLLAARGVGGDAIQTLVKFGGDMNARDHQGKTPLDFARDAKRQSANHALVALGAVGGAEE